MSYHSFLSLKSSSQKVKTARNEKVNIYFSFKCFHKTLHLLFISVSSSHSLRWINIQEYMKIWSPSHSISVVIIHVTLVPTQLMIIFRRKKIKCHFCAASLQHIQTWLMKGGSVFEHCEGGCYSGKGIRWATMRPSGILQFSGMFLFLMSQHTSRHDAVVLS